ncbi:MAG: DUF1190 domain-containing protein [Alphaproteobacteria bacterium]
MGNVKIGGPRKRSNKVVLVAMGMSVSAFALTGCEEKVDAFQFSTVDGCITTGEFTEAECEARFSTAKVEHERAAPRYSSRADCEVEHGVEACAPRDPAQPGQQQASSGGGGLWMPLMIGWMMGRSLGGPVATQPLYRSAKSGMARTASGSTVDAKSGKTSVAKRAAARPAAGKVMARGGFGRTGGSVGSRSFGG